MSQPIVNQTAIGYARSLEKILDFVSDMKDIQLPNKLIGRTSDLPKVNVQISEDLIKNIDSLGTIQSPQQATFTEQSKMPAGKTSLLNKSQDQSLITNDFSKPKNKLGGSRILPEMA